ncbi:MAG: Eco57I restriction-modification methylase domain-containing protein [Geminicoccaceae bacterium]
MTGFLDGLLARPFTLALKGNLKPQSLFVGKGQNALEVAVCVAQRKPTVTELKEAWAARRAGRPAPVLLVALDGAGASLCGPAGEEPPAHIAVDAGQVERICREALAQPDRNSALRFLALALSSLDTPLPGVRNEGLLAMHELARGAPGRADWEAAGAQARKALGKEGEALLSALGFRTERIDNLTKLLRAKEQRTALAVLLEPSETPEADNARFNNLSPVTYALNKADQESLAWVVMVQGGRLRLYPTGVGVGVGRRGRSETFVELQPALLKDEHLAYLWLLFSADALAAHGSLHDLLEGSQRFAGDLATRLRERIYAIVVPGLATAIARARMLGAPTAAELDLTYQMALTALFRLLFIAYAEDRDLLPYRYNAAYRRRSLKQHAQEMAEAERKQLGPAPGDGLWQEVGILWRSVADGNPALGVPAYDGGLFSADPAVSPAGAAIAGITLPNEDFEPALRALLLIETDDGAPGPVDFRSLGVREFGTIYEGLLESELSVADTDLGLDKNGHYLPVKKDAVVRQGGIYLHNRSGARKSSGSYFTKSFAVEHLLDGALEPALDDHLARLDKLDDTDAAEALFDFRVADIAMGSGHFLVAAVDRIERRLTDYLARRPLPGERRELAHLRAAALDALGELADQTLIEDAQLLRRLIARRCIYGVDLNELAVQLARLSIWIHTFVPGLPLSLLDHTLVRGNALVGIGTVEEIRKAFQDAGVGMFAVDAEHLLGMAAAPLKRLATLADATIKDIASGREAMAKARTDLTETETLCDLLTAKPIAGAALTFQLDRWEEERNTLLVSGARTRAREALTGLDVFHFPVAFPEVFLRRRAGFDVIIGNPPWQELTLEEHAFWARFFPGLRGLTQREQEQEKTRLRKARSDLVAVYEAEVATTDRLRAVLTAGRYPGMGTGDPDLYKAFCWRFWNLIAADGGRLGVVLPRSAMAAKGSSEFRTHMLAHAAAISLTMLLNNKNWVFPEVHPQWTIALLAVERGRVEDAALELSGPYSSYERFVAGKGKRRQAFAASDVLSWNDTASLPLLPTEESVEVFARLRKAPRLDLNDGKSWRARPDRELDATNQKSLMDLKSATCPKGFWPVYKGESFDHWNPDTGIYYGFADPKKVMAWLLAKRLRSGKSKRDSAHREFPLAYLRDPKTLPCHRPRIAFRDVSRATDSRTVRCALLPPHVFVANTAPYLLWPRGDEKDQAFLLGVLSSIPLDWYSRRFVETHVNYFVFNPLPVPRPSRADKLGQRTVSLAGRLATPDERFATWASAVGVSYGPIAADEKDDMIHELDAVVAHLYGLSAGQLRHVFETFHEGWGYEERLQATLRHFVAWEDRR